MINIAFVLAGNMPGAPDPHIYRDAARRFAETYRKYPAGYEHRLYLINSNGGYTKQIAEIFSGIEHQTITYNGSGWDIGAQQFAAFSMDPQDWILAGSSWTYFKEPNWLVPFGKAIEKRGDGLYGATTSFEVSPHIRGTAYLIRCGLYQRYPHGINSREDSLKWESDPKMSLTNWVMSQGLPVCVVTRDAIIPLSDSRKLENVFRSGDQSNILVFDKHTDAFENAGAKERQVLTRRSDSSTPPKQTPLAKLRAIKRRLRSELMGKK